MNNIVFGKTMVDGSDASILGKYANRHGLIAGATGTGKSVTLMTVAESFANAGVPVFIADVKGDISAVANSEDLTVEFWDIYGEKGLPINVSLENVGSMMLSKILNLSDTQSGILTIAFKYARDNNISIVSFDDLRSILNVLNDNRETLSVQYGLINSQTVAGVMRGILIFSEESGEHFFNNPSFDIMNFIRHDDNGRGIVNIMDGTKLVLNPSLYSTFLLWMLTELFRILPEMGDVEKPKFVYIFDESHLLFQDATPMLLQKVEQVVRLIRSKGVGVYFCSQVPDDIPNKVLAQLGNKIQHALRAFTPRDQKMIKSAAESFATNPDIDTFNTLQSLGTGEALVSCLSGRGVPDMVQIVKVNLPRFPLGEVDASKRQAIIQGSDFYVVADTVADVSQEMVRETPPNALSEPPSTNAKAIMRGLLPLPHGRSGAITENGPRIERLTLFQKFLRLLF